MQKWELAPSLIYDRRLERSLKREGKTKSGSSSLESIASLIANIPSHEE
jgi:hypothetical protein